MPSSTMTSSAARTQSSAESRTRGAAVSPVAQAVAGGARRAWLHVGLVEDLGPRRQLERDVVGVAEVDGAHEHARVHLTARAPLAVVVVDDRVHSTPAAMSRSRSASISSGATSKATWFIEATAEIGPRVGPWPWWLMPGDALGGVRGTRRTPACCRRRRCRRRSAGPGRRAARRSSPAGSRGRWCRSRRCAPCRSTRAPGGSAPDRRGDASGSVMGFSSSGPGR